MVDMGDAGGGRTITSSSRKGKAREDDSTQVPPSFLPPPRFLLGSRVLGADVDALDLA